LPLAQQQLVEIAKALSANARILIMDEPTSCLTRVETQRLLQIIRDLRAANVAVIYISHRMAEMEEVADRVVVMRDGAVRGELKRGEIRRDAIIGLMAGPSRAAEPSGRKRTARNHPARLQVEGVRTQRYPDHTLSFSIGRGEILGLTGLIGAGRSEVAETIFGIRTALDLRLRIDGRPVEIGSPRDAIRNGLYLLPEDRREAGLISSLTIRENIVLPNLRRHSRYGISSHASESRSSHRICTELGVKMSSVEEKTVNLSGGNQQKVALGKWLQLAPRVLLLDEPTRGIDIMAKSEIYGVIHRLLDEGVAIMLISSDVEEILAMCDRVAIMHEGALIGFLAHGECSEEKIMRMIVGEAPRLDAVSLNDSSVLR
jgi:ribose transport system ATP-binding protein